MPYISEAARELGITDKTLRKWMRLLTPSITATKHHYDPRYHIISAEDVERIRQARAELPGQPSPVSSS
ncbi:MAG TPA: MerR family transcriptional regulator [Ktedonobacteraceae bacterium]|nr:MerR family transcriptional regulator [Ktedonobacteraceae bacterium]